ncbi:MAG TPA: START domain-containing protein [Puia sp.]|nr:START domain-containing protein [Puia sp.]
MLTGIGYVAFGQDGWTLKSEKEGIRVYTRTFPDSKFKAIRVELELQASLSQMVAVLLDVNAGVDWVYATKSSVLLKRVSPTELYYYSEVSLPWPFSNRDFIAQLKVRQDSATRIVTIDGPTVADYLPVKKDIVRVARSEGKWVLRPIRKGRIRVEYELRTDPGGDIPAWLFNLFVTRGPMESFENLKRQLKKPAYSNVRLAFIAE